MDLFDIEAYKRRSEMEERYIVNRFRERRNQTEEEYRRPESVGRKRKMGERKETTTDPKWPSIKSKNNLHITRLRDFDLFTVTIQPFFFFFCQFYL